jgi:hypothetical protein
MRWVLSLAATTLLCLQSCGGSDDSGMTVRVNGGPASAADISILFMGNSHTSVNDLTGMVAAMVRAGRPGKSVTTVVAPGWMFLDERLTDGPSVELLRSQRWSAVVLQAQKYSTSGQFTYSTAEAEEWIRMIRTNGGLPIMFPEWPRRNVDETSRIYALHVSIAQREPACVAPVGQAWDLALTRHPTLVLHDADGNHSAPAGAFLTALILYATVTMLSPLDLPTLPVGIDSQTQATLRTVAAETVQTSPPRQWCSADPAL